MNFTVEPENQVTDVFLRFLCALQISVSQFGIALRLFSLIRYLFLYLSLSVSRVRACANYSGNGGGRGSTGITNRFHQINLRTIWMGRIYELIKFLNSRTLLLTWLPACIDEIYKILTWWESIHGDAYIYLQKTNRSMAMLRNQFIYYKWTNSKWCGYWVMPRWSGRICCGLHTLDYKMYKNNPDPFLIGMKAKMYPESSSASGRSGLECGLNQTKN